MQISSLLRSIIIWWVVCRQTRSFTVTRNKEYRGSGEVIAGKDGLNAEPSCEELKAMWRLSKRQSRAAEMTNEIPTYRDPFSFNVWEPYYARSRSMGGAPVRPVYGRLVHKAPIMRIQDVAERNRALEEMARMYGMNRNIEPRRRMTAFRLSGGGHLPIMGIPPQSGSFQHLKELIRNERARELHERRMAEEAASRNDALKELASGGKHRATANLRDMGYAYDMEGSEEPETLPAHKTVLAFPDILAPAARFEPDEPTYIEDYYFRDRPRNHRSLFQSSSFNNDMEGLVL